tara:strand:- start:1237 stop:1617 length:381 start_codon:yes stop_codon:yes gene_type:complete
MNSSYSKNRWVILEHRLNKINLEGIHYDLLIEDGPSCKSWRLTHLPVVDGPAVQAIASEPHKLEWLEKKEAFVSCGRGWAHQVQEGIYEGSLSSQTNSEVISITIHTNTISAILQLSTTTCKILSI